MQTQDTHNQREGREEQLRLQVVEHTRSRDGEYSKPMRGYLLAVGMNLTAVPVVFPALQREPPKT